MYGLEEGFIIIPNPDGIYIYIPPPHRLWIGLDWIGMSCLCNNTPRMTKLLYVELSERSSIKFIDGINGIDKVVPVLNKVSRHENLSRMSSPVLTELSGLLLAVCFGF
jgi:hypothetical protein